MKLVAGLLLTLCLTGAQAQEGSSSDLATLKTKVEALENKLEASKVAFTAVMTGPFGPVTVETTLIYPKVITNVGNAYSSITGIFTAPVHGVYYFRFYVMDDRKSHHMGAALYKNSERILRNYAWNHWQDHEHVSNAVILELAQNDIVYMRLPPNFALFDKPDHNFNTFSGFLLFPMLNT